MTGSSPHRPRPVRALRGLWNGLDALRRAVVNLLLLGLLCGLAVAAWRGRPRVPKGGALLVRPAGLLVEQLSRRPSLPVPDELSGAAPRETLARDLVDALDAARADRRIAVVHLDLDAFGGGSLVALRTVGEALTELRKAGKKVIASADGYGQAAYYLAARADEVLLDPDGRVVLEGYGRFRRYYREGLERLGVNVHVFRVGEFKSAVEPYLRDDMSPEAREADAAWLGDLWRGWLADVAAARRTTAEKLAAYVDDYPERLKAAGGDGARLALDEKLVDRLAPRDAIRKRLVELAGEDKESRSYRRVGVAEYLAALGKDRTGTKGGGDAVAVVVAQGEIVDGTAGPGRVGGDSTAALIRRAREDRKVKAIVLRIDSPGGSAFASEVIRRELALAREAGKPVVASMAGVAASGGYWIATASDEIVASPATITGSIGIFGMVPTFERPLARFLGIHVDGVGTTRYAGALRLDRELSPGVATAIQASIDHGYEEFLSRVGKARKMSRDEVDRIARGRVWSGTRAKELGLVDRFGGLPEALESAARRASLRPGYRVLWVERGQSLRDRLLAALSAAAVRLSPGEAEDDRLPPDAAARLAAGLGEDLERLAAWNDPGGVYAHCLCETR